MAHTQDPMSKAIDEYAREVMRLCDTQGRGKCDAKEMEENLTGPQFEPFGDFMLENGQRGFQKYDKDHDGAQDLHELQSAVRGYFEYQSYHHHHQRKEGSSQPSEGEPNVEELAREIMRLSNKEYREGVADEPNLNKQKQTLSYTK